MKIMFEFIVFSQKKEEEEEENDTAICITLLFFTLGSRIKGDTIITTF